LPRIAGMAAADELALLICSTSGRSP